MKHVNANPLCDLTPVFKDYENYLAGIEQQLSDGGSSDPERESSKMALDTQSPALFGSTKLQQESTFLFHSDKTEGTSEKKTEAVPEKKGDPSLGATSASFNFGKKIDGSVLGSLNSGPLAGFSFSSGNSGLFGKDVTQSKPLSSPFAVTGLESQAGGGKGECDAPPRRPAQACDVCVEWKRWRRGAVIWAVWSWAGLGLPVSAFLSAKLSKAYFIGLL